MRYGHPFYPLNKDVTMKQINSALIVILAASLTLGSCKSKNVFDQEGYDKIITGQFPIEPIDQTQMWNLSTRRTVSINVNANLENMEKLMVLTANPAVNSDAQIMAEEANPEEGHTYTMLFVTPDAKTTFCAAIKTTDNRYAIVEFNTSDKTVNFNNKVMATINTEPKRQAFTYCFEENFPMPGDYDFNDCVMRMSIQPGSKKNQLRLNVTLEAVGAKIPMAGAVRLCDYNYNDIESVEIADGKAFDDGYPLQKKYIPEDATLLRGRNNVAVIRLFEDAMWCMVKEDPDNIGILTRKNINVTRATDETNLHRTPITKTYIITFKESSAALLNNFLEDKLDPFIVTLFNAGYWETHVYTHQQAQALYEYPDQNDVHMLWALCVPSGNFRWPLEGKLIGNYKDNILTGTYREYNHSFGQWAAQKEQSRDWFYYPTVTEVY